MKTADSEAAVACGVYVVLGVHVVLRRPGPHTSPGEDPCRGLRAVLRVLDEAAVGGRLVRAAWDFDAHWTLAEALSRHAPDLLDAVRRRVQSGVDDLVLASYNNGANHAATERELRAALARAVDNPQGSGYRQVFGRAPSILRPAASMHTAGMNHILLDEGIDGLVLDSEGGLHTALAYTLLGLPAQQRYNPFWLRCTPDEPPIAAWQCLSPLAWPDSAALEALLLRLRRLQTSGQVACDLLVPLSVDVGSEASLAARLRGTIDAVGRHPWARFTVPAEVRAGHPPRAELLVRQDLAAGGFDGHYSWAEKHGSLAGWTQVERARTHGYRAEALAESLPPPGADEVRARLREPLERSFELRLAGLDVRHWGPGTPEIDDRLQSHAEHIWEGARSSAVQAERLAARALRDAPLSPPGPADDDLLYTAELHPLRPEGTAPAPATAPVRLPVILPAWAEGIWLAGPDGAAVPASLVDVHSLHDTSRAADLLFQAPCRAGEPRRYQVRTGPPPDGLPERHAPRPWRVGQPAPRLSNRWLELRLSPETGIEALTFEGRQVGASDLLRPYIAYRSGWRPRGWTPLGYLVSDLPGETWCGLSRARLQTWIEMDTPFGPAATQLQYTFTLFDDAPYLLVDVDAEYAGTPQEDQVEAPGEMRRLLDLRWIEVAPFQIHPALVTSPAQPFRVWKHNHLGVVSSYELDYGRTNSRNRNLEAFNHQVTAGWVAVSTGEQGLLIAECGDALASMAFCPMRLVEQDGRQRLWLNPFGSYHGRPPDHRPLGAGSAVAFGDLLQPNAPSFNGKSLRFSLLLAPYLGDAPPPQLQAAAQLFFRPPALAYLHTPPGVDALLPDDVRRRVADDERGMERLRRGEEPLPLPRALVAWPSSGAVSLAWEPSRDIRVTGYEVRWQPAGGAGWQALPAAPGPRGRVDGLPDGQPTRFQVRSLGGRSASGWSAPVSATPGQPEPPPHRKLSWRQVRSIAGSLARRLAVRLR